jgi:PAS domain S-box-containing protein
LHEVLHQEKELSAGLFAHAQAAVLILDPQGRIVRCNPFVERLTNLALDQIQERDWFDLFLEQGDRSRVRQALLRGASQTAVTASSVYQGDPHALGPRHLHWSGLPLFDAEGRPFAILVIGHDITDLHQAQQRALQAERLAAVGQMATGLAHESRNALQRIGASAETLELELEGNAAALTLVGRIQQSQGHLHQLLEEVRSYAAPILLDRSRCRISEVWREAWELLLAQRRGREAVLREQVEECDLAIDADRFRLVRVFRNLLENALAACNDPVLIDIRCEPAAVGHRPGLVLSVRDNGPGLGEEQRRKIFDPFYTTKPTGTGLGMAIAQRIIEAHGGWIAVGPSPPPGAEILIGLPREAV